MSEQDATKLVSLCCDHYGEKAAYVYQIGNGELVVRIRTKDYWLWSFADWEHYRRAKKGARKAAVHQVAIDSTEPYTLRMPALV